MTFNWEYLVIALIVCAAIYYLVRKGYDAFFGKEEHCGSGCGCEAKKITKTSH